MLRRRVLDHVGRFDPEWDLAIDYDLWLRVAEGGHEIVWNAQPLAVYRVRPGSLMASTGLAMTSSAEVYARALDRGRLDRRGRLIARRQRRLYRYLARPTLPLGILVFLERPDRWWARIRGALRPRSSARAGRG